MDMSFHFPGNCIFVWGTSRRLSLARLDWETALPGRFHHSELVWCADVPRCCISALYWFSNEITATLSCCKQLCQERLVLFPTVCTAPSARCHGFCWAAGTPLSFPNVWARRWVGVMSWHGQLCQKGARQLSLGSPGDGVVPRLPSETRTLKGS